MLKEISFVMHPAHKERNSPLYRSLPVWEKHGINLRRVSHPENADTKYAVCWGWNNGNKLRQKGHEVLVFECGYIGDRAYWSSIGWNGLNNRADFKLPERMRYRRFDGNFGHLLKPWKAEGEGDKIIIMGQLKNDMSLQGNDLTCFYEELGRKLKEKYDLPVLFRRHPKFLHRNFQPNLPLAPAEPLEKALESARLVLAYNSNATVESVIAGVPSITFDRGAMAWDMTSHSPDEDLVRPDREEWLTKVSHCQWSLPEIEAGKFIPRMLGDIDDG